MGILSRPRLVKAVQVDNRQHGFIAGTMINTPDGILPVQFLSPGDRIITRSGMRILRAISVRQVENTPIIRIRSAALGKSHPEADQFIAPDQEISLRGPNAVKLCGTSCATLPAHQLIDRATIEEEIIAEIRLFDLHFDRDETIYAGGLELLCHPVA